MENYKNFFNDKIKKLIYPAIFLLFIAVGFYQSFIRDSNEIGFLGADKDGRQVLIQTLDEQLKPSVRVNSDFFQHSFLYRLLIQEPMRTTIIFDLKNLQNENQNFNLEGFLNQPHDDFIKNFRDKIFMQERYSVSPDDLKKQLNEKGAKTMEDLLAGFGFKKIQIIENGQITIREIRGTKNVYWVGF
ncbi:MAG: hypothetical protein V1667_03735 [bacterium]